MRHRISRDARLDLDEIFIYWAKRANLTIAEKPVDQIEERFRLLAEYPDAGKSVDHLAPDMSCFPVGRYLIYYRKTKKGTEVVRILHGARNQEAAFKKAKKRE
jgi:toxin ParE1/3/4